MTAQCSTLTLDQVKKVQHLALREAAVACNMGTTQASVPSCLRALLRDGRGSLSTLPALSPLTWAAPTSLRSSSCSAASWACCAGHTAR